MRLDFLELGISASAAQQLTYAVNYNRFPHAAIIEGGTAETRLSTAKHIAAALMCRDEADKPCLACAHCHKVLSGNHPDVEYYSEKNNKGSRKTEAFVVDTVRDIVRSVGILPNESDCKIYILENTQLMNIQAQNAFLKILEEPPKYAYFMLLCSKRSNFLDTILSRARLYTVGECVEDEEKRTQEAVEAAMQVMKAVTASNDYEIIKAAAVFEKDKNLFEAALGVMNEIAVEAMKAGVRASTSEEFEGLPAFLASRLTQERLVKITQSLAVIASSYKSNANYNLLLTRLCSLLRAE